MYTSERSSTDTSACYALSHTGKHVHAHTQVIFAQMLLAEPATGPVASTPPGYGNARPDTNVDDEAVEVMEGHGLGTSVMQRGKQAGATNQAKSGRKIASDVEDGLSASVGNAGARETRMWTRELVVLVGIATVCVWVRGVPCVCV